MGLAGVATAWGTAEKPVALQMRRHLEVGKQDTAVEFA
jgi:hypothetical protein